MSAALLTVWLEPYEEKAAARVGVLCRNHADTMVVPRGWSLEDRRDPEPQLFRTGDTAPTTSLDRPAERANADLTPPTAATPAGEPAAKPRPKRARKKADDTGQLELVPTTEETDTIAPPPDPAAVTGELPAEDVPPDATPFAPWRPKFYQTDDLDGLLHAQSPLLARAFRGHRAAPETDH